jgi:hypothetical protein
VNVGSAQYNPTTRQIIWGGSPAAGQAVTLTYSVVAQSSGPLALTNTARLSGAAGSSSAAATIYVDAIENFLPLVNR